MKLSDHFDLSEFVVSQEAARHGVDNTPTAEIIENLRAVASALEQVRSLFGGRPITITSGYRSPKLNALIGGAKDSAHMDGWAADFLCPAVGNPMTLCVKIMGSEIKFDQLINEGADPAKDYAGWVHLSVAPAMRRQILTASFSSNGPTYAMGLTTKPLVSV